MKEYPKIEEQRKKQLIDFMEKYRKKGEINRTEIVKKKNNQNEYDFMHDWLESNNIEIIGQRVDEYDYTDPLEEKEISEKRKDYLIQYVKNNIKKDSIQERLIFQVCKNDNELDLVYDWLEDNNIDLTGINSSLIGEIPNFKNIFRDGTAIDLPDYEPLAQKRKEQLKYEIKGLIKNKSISNDELLNLAENELEYLYMHDWLNKNKIEIENIDKKHKYIKKSYKQAAYEEANKMDIELFKKMEQGDKGARKKIIEHNLRLASWVVNGYKSIYDDIVNVEDEDKLHYARVGLIKAVDKFDYKKGFRFSTFAVKRMKWDIDRYLYKELLIRTPVHVLEQINALKRIEDGFKQKGITPTDDMLLEMQPELRSRDVIERLRCISNLINYESLDESLVKEDKESKLLNLDDSQRVQDYDNEAIDEGIYLEDEVENIIEILAMEDMEYREKQTLNARSLRNKLDEVLHTLTEREEKVLRLRFGLDDGRSRSLEEVGQIFRVTRERVRQIEAKALRKLRHPNRSYKVRDYLDDGESTLGWLHTNRLKRVNPDMSWQINDNNGPRQYFEGINEKNIIDTMEIEYIPDDELEKMDINNLQERVEIINEKIRVAAKEMRENLHNIKVARAKKEELKALYDELEEIRIELDENEK